MSDYAFSKINSGTSFSGKKISSACMFATLFIVFLIRATISRAMPWRTKKFFRRSEQHESIFSEASTAANVCTSSSYMGL